MEPCRKRRRMDDNDIQEKLRIAKEYYDKEELEMARLLLLEILEMECTDDDVDFVHYYLGRVYQKEGMETKAIKHFEKSMTEDAYKRWAQICMDLGNWDDAITVLQQASVIFKSTYAMINLGTLYESRGEVLDAQQYYCMAIDNGDGKGAFHLGNLYKSIHEFEIAVEAYLLAIKMNYLEAYVALGRMYATGRGLRLDMKKALQCYLRVSSSADAMMNAGLLYEFGHPNSIDPNLQKAYACYARASMLGDSEAIEMEQAIKSKILCCELYYGAR